MKTKSLAFTRVELLVVVGICVLFVLLVIPSLARDRAKSQRIACISRLVNIGVTYRVWATDNNGNNPAQSTNGWKGIVDTTNASRFCWTNYVVMAVPLGESPLILTCPSDIRRPAAILKTNQSSGMANTNISYFVGVGSCDTYPQSILAGDRNLAPGPQPSNDFGFSPSSGMGADVTLSTNNSTVCWSLKMHSAGNVAGAGNILLGDGSAQQCSSSRFRTDYLSNAAAENTNGTFRLIFP